MFHPNATLDLGDLDLPEIRREAVRIGRTCRWCLPRGVRIAVNGRLRRRLRIRSFKLWEYSRGLAFASPRKGDRLLEVGGSGSILSYTLLREGHAIRGLDLDLSLMRYAREVAGRFGWSFETNDADLCRSDIPEAWGSFDRIYCFSVLEHLPPEARGEFLRRLGDGLAKGGILALTFDFGQDAPTPGALRDLGDVADVVRRTGLALLGGEEFRDTGRRYAIDRKHPDRRFAFGSLFLTKG